jgi:hypothetical protein
MIATRDTALHWRRFDQTARDEEGRYETAALLLFTTERREIVAKVLTAAPEAKEAADPMEHSRVFPYIEAALLAVLAEFEEIGKYATAWRSRFRRRIESTVRRALGRQELARVGIRFDLANPRVQALIEQRTARLVTNVTETTRAAIRDAIALGRLRGMGTQQMATLIRDTTYGEITKARAQVIARTETVGALNAGEYLAATGSGIMRSKTWITQADGRVRPSHAAQNNLTIPLADVFPNGLRFPHEPGAPADEVIQCRCTMLFSDEEP